MGRLAEVTSDLLDDEQQALWDTVTGGRRAASHANTGGLVAPTGGLIGPFNAWLHSPVVGVAAARLGESVRYDNSLERDVLELAIVTVAIHWRSEFEHWAHRGYAVEAGVPADLLDRLRDGLDLAPIAHRYEVTVRSCRELLSTGTLGETTYRELAEELSARAVVDLVTTVGYYTLVSFNLNAFEVELPDGAEPVWA